MPITNVPIADVQQFLNLLKEQRETLEELITNNELEFAPANGNIGKEIKVVHITRAGRENGPSCTS